MTPEQLDELEQRTSSGSGGYVVPTGQLTDLIALARKGMEKSELEEIGLAYWERIDIERQMSSMTPPEWNAANTRRIALSYKLYQMTAGAFSRKGG